MSSRAEPRDLLWADYNRFLSHAKALETISTGHGETDLAGAGEGHRDQKLWSVTWVTLWISEWGWMVPFGDARTSSGFRITEVTCRI